jgi:muramidase (phage lysozyme)
MTVINSSAAGGSQIIAFMNMLAVAEGTSTSPITQCDGYDVIVTGVDGRHRFDDLSTHPFANGRSSIVVNSRGLTSNASGRYQNMLKDWAHYRDLLHLPDFGPLSQDRWCIQLLKERGAIQPLIDGDLVTAIARCANIWASLPGNSYGQPQHALDTLRAAFVLNGGNLC